MFAGFIASGSAGKSQRVVTVAVAVVATLIALLAVIANPTAAQAESNYRVCGAYNSGQQDLLGTGLVVKVYKHGPDTCSLKLAFMKRYYYSAYKGSSVKMTFSMMTCEEFAIKTGMTPVSHIVDPCPRMDVNKIYKYTSYADSEHPSGTPKVDADPWRN